MTRSDVMWPLAYAFLAGEDLQRLLMSRTALGALFWLALAIFFIFSALRFAWRFPTKLQHAERLNQTILNALRKRRAS